MIFSDRSWPPDLESLMIKGAVNLLKDSCQQANISLGSVGLVTEFGLGVGRHTRAIRQVFSGAKVQVIDFEDKRDVELKADPKILFNQGSFTNVLESGVIQPADVVLFYHTGDQHGFNSNNIDLLVKAVGQGILITGGHLGPIYSDAFRNKFNLVAQVEEDGLHGTFVWRVK